MAPTTTSFGFDVHPRLISEADEDKYTNFMQDIMREFGIEDTNERANIVGTPVGPYIQFVESKQLAIPGVSSFKSFLRFAISSDTDISASEDTAVPDKGNPAGKDAPSANTTDQMKEAQLTINQVAETFKKHFGLGRIKMWSVGGKGVGQKIYSDEEVEAAEKQFGRGREIGVPEWMKGDVSGE